MITFKQFLSEQEAVDLIELIKRDCAPYLKAAGKGFNLYRGMEKPKAELQFGEVNGEEVQFMRITPRTDRKPRTMPQEEHDIMDAWFEENFGWKARSQGVFTYSDSTTTTYGTNYLIYPIGQFKFVYSPKIYDLYSDLPYNLSSAVDPEKLRDFLDGKAYTDHDLRNAKSAEIMVKCDGYYAMHHKYEELMKALYD